MSMEKQILLPTRVKAELRDAFEITHTDVDRAFKFQRNSPRANMLREAAIRQGGVLYVGALAPEGYISNVETRFDHVRGMMYQSLGERVELELELETNNVSLFIDNEPVATFTDMTVTSWGNVLYSLQLMYSELVSKL